MADELCLADYDELDAAEQDLVLALIYHKGAGGDAAGGAGSDWWVRGADEAWRTPLPGAAKP